MSAKKKATSLNKRNICFDINPPINPKFPAWENVSFIASRRPSISCLASSLEIFVNRDKMLGIASASNFVFLSLSLNAFNSAVAPVIVPIISAFTILPVIFPKIPTFSDCESAAFTNELLTFTPAVSKLLSSSFNAKRTSFDLLFLFSKSFKI